MTHSSCPRAAEILEAATDPERRPLGADAVSHLRTCPHCRDLASDVALVELFTRTTPPALPAALETLPGQLLTRPRSFALRSRIRRGVAAALLLGMAFIAGRWSSGRPNSSAAPSRSGPTVVRVESPRTDGLFSRREIVVEPTKSPRGFLAALKPK